MESVRGVLQRTARRSMISGGTWGSNAEEGYEDGRKQGLAFLLLFFGLSGVVCYLTFSRLLGRGPHAWHGRFPFGAVFPLGPLLSQVCSAPSLFLAPLCRWLLLGEGISHRSSNWHLTIKFLAFSLQAFTYWLCFHSVNLLVVGHGTRSS